MSKKPAPPLDLTLREAQIKAIDRKKRIEEAKRKQAIARHQTDLLTDLRDLGSELMEVWDE